MRSQRRLGFATRSRRRASPSRPGPPSSNVRFLRSRYVQLGGPQQLQGPGINPEHSAASLDHLSARGAAHQLTSLRLWPRKAHLTLGTKYVAVEACNLTSARGHIEVADSGLDVRRDAVPIELRILIDQVSRRSIVELRASRPECLLLHNNHGSVFVGQFGPAGVKHPRGSAVPYGNHVLQPRVYHRASQQRAGQASVLVRGFGWHSHWSGDSAANGAAAVDVSAMTEYERGPA